MTYESAKIICDRKSFALNMSLGVTPAEYAEARLFMSNWKYENDMKFRHSVDRRVEQISSQLGIRK